MQGLGTSTPKEAKEYFAALQQHKKKFVWSGDEDGECIELAFSKKKVENRKQWLRNFEVMIQRQERTKRMNRGSQRLTR